MPVAFPKAVPSLDLEQDDKNDAAERPRVRHEILTSAGVLGARSSRERPRPCTREAYRNVLREPATAPLKSFSEAVWFHAWLLNPAPEPNETKTVTCTASLLACLGEQREPRNWYTCTTGSKVEIAQYLMQPPTFVIAKDGLCQMG